MEYCLENEQLRVKVSSFGGELQSIEEKETGREYLWQGDERFWNEKAPNLFPYIARLTNGTYTYQGKEYSMQIHGIVKYREMDVRKEADTLVCSLDADQDTLTQYPFHFRYEIRYRLQGSRLSITYRVENQEDHTMYFGIGGHPGFQVPFIEGTDFEDYVLSFPQAEQPARILFSKDCFVEGETPYSEIKEGELSLRHDRFDEDAIVLKNAGHVVRLCPGKNWQKTADTEQRKNMRTICVRFPQMDYIGFWHSPKTEAPYVCIEPWSSLPSRQGIVEALEQQENLLSLEAKKSYENTWEIELESI